MEYITLLDLAFFPIVLLISYGIATSLKNRYYPLRHPFRPYFVPAVIVKVVAAFLIGIVYQFYYGYGDTFGYFNMGVFFSKIVKASPSELIKVYFTGDADYYGAKAYEFGFSSWYAFQPATITIARISSLINLFTFDNYLLTSYLFALVSFSGIWKMFRVFATLYPSLIRPIAWIALFIPSVLFWGSGILKDTLTIGAIGWLVFGIWSLFILNKRIVSSIIIIILMVYLFLRVKPYILLSLLVPLFFWIISHFRKKIQNPVTRAILIPLILTVTILLVAYISTRIGEENEYLALDNLAENAVRTQQNISIYEAGSAYSMGTISPGLLGFAQKAPLAFITTLFRPFLWESNSVVMLFSALESFLIALFTVWTFFKVGLFKMIKLTFTKQIIFFCFSFVLIFAVPVAISAGNFGTLVRYKIPCIPFYLLSILLSYHYSGKKMPVWLHSPFKSTKPTAKALPVYLKKLPRP